MPRALSRSGLSLRAYLVLLAGAALLPMSVLAAWLSVTIARDQRAAQRGRMQETAQVLAAAVDRDLYDSVHTLQAVAAWSSMERPDPGVLREDLARLVGGQRGWRAITLETPEGQPVVETARPPAITDPARPERIREVLDRGVPVVAHDRDTAPDAFVVRVPVTRDGIPRFVLSATVSADSVTAGLVGHGLPPAWSTSLVDARGDVLASLPAAPALARRPRFPFVTGAAAAGWGGRADMPEGPVYFAYARPQLTDWHLVLAAPVTALDAPWRQTVAVLVGAGVAALLGSVAVAALVARPIVRSCGSLARATAELREGRRPRPIGSSVTELARVSDDLTVAADALESTESAEREGLARLSALVNQPTVGIAQIDADGRFVLANQRYCELAGRAADQLVGHPLEEVLVPEERARYLDLVHALTEEQPERTGETRYRSPSGVDRWVDTSCSLVLPEAPGAAAHGAVSIVAVDAGWRRAARAAERERDDLRARERTARHEAEAAGQIKDEFLAALSHELRAPLNAVRIWAGLLKRDVRDPQSLARAADTIDRNAVLQTRLIEELLDVARIVSGRLQLVREPVVLAPVIDAALESARPAALNKGVTLVRRVAGDGAVVLGDAIRLQQVVWNLLANAVRFTSAGGRVAVALRRIGDRAVLTVADSGRGIAPELLPHVFDRFRQGESGTTRSHGGLGLGLSIARQLVELHGGTIEAASPGVGAGATFTVSLPLAGTTGTADPGSGAERSPLPVVRPDRETERALEHVHVLLVDDDTEARDVMALGLSQQGATVTTAPSVAEALVALERQWPDVLVGDIGMPGEDGYDLIRKVRRLEASHGRHIPAIAVTGYAADEDRRRAVEAGYELHVAKPVPAAAVVPLIRSLVAPHGSRLTG